MRNRIIIYLLILFITLAFCGCENKKLYFTEYKDGDIISNSVDGNIYKLNSKFIMFDDGGYLKDNIVKLNSSEVDSYETVGDYYNGGTIYFSDIIKEVYCSERYIIAILHNSQKCIVIDCSKSRKYITESESLDSINIDYSGYTKIKCHYYT